MPASTKRPPAAAITAPIRCHPFGQPERLRWWQHRQQHVGLSRQGRSIADVADAGFPPADRYALRQD